MPFFTGCYYLLKHYQNGEQIETNEPCLNCSCVNSMLMCYLRVCPYVRPLGDKCIIEKVPGECCPRITCPDRESKITWKKYLLINDSTVEPEPEPTTPEPEVGEGCYIEGEHYREGALIPSDPDKPCEVCYCIRNSSACVIQECTLGVSGCSPVFSPKSCCPTRYNCCEYSLSYWLEILWAVIWLPQESSYSPKKVFYERVARRRRRWWWWWWWWWSRKESLWQIIFGSLTFLPLFLSYVFTWFMTCDLWWCSRRSCYNSTSWITSPFSPRAGMQSQRKKLRWRRSRSIQRCLWWEKE